MSKPVQEPIFPRQLRQQRYGIDQLFRRPAPATGNDPVVFRAMQWSSGTSTPAGGDLAQAEFDYFDDITGPVFGGSLNGAGTKLQTIEGLLDGLYITTMTWFWDGLAFSSTIRHAGEIENNLGIGIVEPNMVEMPRTLGGHGGGDASYSFTIIQYYPRLYDQLNLATPLRPRPDYSFWVGQNSAGAVDAYVSAEVAYWPADTPAASS